MRSCQITSRVRRQQAGFSLIVIFALMAIMAAMAASVLLTSRTDIKVAGRQRESTVAFFTAEAGLAYGKVYLASQWNTATYWSSVLADPARTATYDAGGISLGGGQTLNRLRTRYTYSFQNNPDDPSLDPQVDSDGKVIITSVGVALDQTGLNVLATSTVQVEVQYGTPSLLKGNYDAQSNQGASGAGKSNDINPVQMNQSTGL